MTERTLPKRPSVDHPVVHNIQAIAELERNVRDERTPFDRVTAAVTRMAGSTTFIAVHGHPCGRQHGVYRGSCSLVRWLDRDEYYTVCF